MLDWKIAFDQPVFLWLLLLLPVIWWMSRRSLAGMGALRRRLVITLRFAVVIAIVAALAEVQLTRSHGQVTVIFLLDQSESIPESARETMRDYVLQTVEQHRQPDDLAGVVSFGRSAKVEHPPFDEDIYTLESRNLPWTDATDIETALNLARALFTDQTSKRIVLVSDGNENRGDSVSMAQSMTQDGIGIDVVPVLLGAFAEVAVEKLTVPSSLRKGQPFEARVLVNNLGRQSVPGTVTVKQRSGQRESLVSELPVTLAPGKNVYRFDHELDRSDMFTFRAEFSPTDKRLDRVVTNNAATAFTHVRGQGNVLLVENADSPGEFDYLVRRLRLLNLDVTVINSSNLWREPAELLPYDSIVLANVPRSSGDDENQVTSFSDEQIRMLVNNTEQMGCGLVLLGGPNSYGAGGWTNTALEEAMPVDFQIRNAKEETVGALAMIMHASEIAEGNHWQKVVAIEALKALGPHDYCGLLHFDNAGDSWLWNKNGKGIIPIGENRKQMLMSLDKMAPGDMPQFEPAMKMCLEGLSGVDAAVKHVIIISDGDPAPPTDATVKRFAEQEIKITTVAVGAHGPAGHQTLAKIAKQTDGHYYIVNDSTQLPRIYQREARRVAKPLLFKRKEGIGVSITGWNEIVDGLDSASLRPITGYVMTTRKDSALVEQLMVAERPADGGVNSTILASWNYGLGKSIAFTTDAGARWAESWTSADYYDRFFANMIRSSMRSITADGQFSVATSRRDGRVQVVVNALDEDNQFLNSLDMTARVTRPDEQPISLRLQQTASGRYVGEFIAEEAGSYLLNVVPGPGYRLVKTGVNVPHSTEFTDRETNWGLLDVLAGLQAAGGTTGQLSDDALDDEAEHLDALLATNPFRRDLAEATSRQSFWPSMIVIAAVVFFADVLLRRVALSFAWGGVLYNKIADKLWRARDEDQEAEVRLERLRSRKTETAKEFTMRGTLAEVDEPPERLDFAETDTAILDDADGTNASQPQPPASKADQTSDENENETLTSRLLKAKRQALKKKQ